MEVVLCDTTFCLKPLTRLQGAWRKQRLVSMQRVAGVGEGAEKERGWWGGGGDWVEQGAVLKHNPQTVPFEVVG